MNNNGSVLRTTEEMIKIMQTFLDGKKIEFRGISGWMPANKPCWNWVRFDYRIKIEPRKIWVNVYSTYNGAAFYSLSESIEREKACPHTLVERIMYVEVMDDE